MLLSRTDRKPKTSTGKEELEEIAYAGTVTLRKFTKGMEMRKGAEKGVVYFKKVITTGHGPPNGRTTYSRHQ